MPMEWEREELILKQQALRQTSQILLEGDVIAPDSRPDITEVLSCHGNVRIKEIRPADERVNFSGELELNILYTSEKGGKGIYAMEASLPIEDVIYMEGLEKDMQLRLRAELGHLECQIINDRKVGVKAVIAVTASAESANKLSIILPKDGEDAAFLQETLHIQEATSEKKNRFTVKEELTLPSVAAPIGEILDKDIRLIDQELHPMDGKVMLRSNLSVDILYQDNNGGIHTFTEKIPFSGYIEAEGINPRSIVQAELTLNEAAIKPVLDEDGEPRILAVDAAVMAEVSGMENIDRQVVADAYIPGTSTTVERQTITYPVFVGRGANSFTLKEKITLSPNESPMLQAAKIWGGIDIEETRPLDNIVEVDGVFFVEILYFCREDDEAFCFVKKGMPFTQRVELKGVLPTDEVFVTGRVESSDFQIISDREGEAVASILLEISAMRLETAQLVTNIDVADKEPEKNMPGAVIYTVQPGDSLWTIAKKYDTTIGRILMVNDIEDPDVIYPGEKLLIIKMPPKK